MALHHDKAEFIVHFKQILLFIRDLSFKMVSITLIFHILIKSVLSLEQYVQVSVLSCNESLNVFELF